MAIAQFILEKILNNDWGLATLDLSQQNLEDDDILKLAESLKHNNTVTTLNLSHNRIGSEGARALAKALQVNSTLTDLRLGHNEIGDAGGRALGEALLVNSTLTNLELNHNPIDKRGMIGLAEGLKANKTLENLDLSNNNANLPAGHYLNEALKVNTTLVSLDFSGNQLESGEARMRAKAIIGSGSKNIISVKGPTTDELTNYCEANRKLARLFIDKMRQGQANAEDKLQINARLPAIRYVAMHELQLSSTAIADLLTADGLTQPGTNIQQATRQSETGMPSAPPADQEQPHKRFNTKRDDAWEQGF